MPNPLINGIHINHQPELVRASTLYFGSLTSRNWKDAVAMCHQMRPKVLMVDLFHPGSWKPIGFDSVREAVGCCDYFRKMLNVHIALHCYLNNEGVGLDGDQRLIDWSNPPLPIEQLVYTTAKELAPEYRGPELQCRGRMLFKKDKPDTPVWGTPLDTNGEVRNVFYASKGLVMLPESVAGKESIARCQTTLDVLKPTMVYVDGTPYPRDIDQGYVDFAKEYWSIGIEPSLRNYEGLVQIGGAYFEPHPPAVRRKAIYDAYPVENKYGGDYDKYLEDISEIATDVLKREKAEAIVHEAGWLPLGEGTTRDFIRRVYSPDCPLSEMPKSWQVLESWNRNPNQNEVLALIGAYEERMN